MLRLRPTQIELNSRDHRWHKVRHEGRQLQCARGSLVVQHHNKQIQDDHLTASRYKSSEDIGIIATPQMPLFSNKPDLHKFWSGVVAGAGVLPEVQSAARSVLVSEPADDVSSLRSFSASIEENQDMGQDIEGTEPSYSRTRHRAGYHAACGVSSEPHEHGITHKRDNSVMNQDDSGASTQEGLLSRRPLSLFPVRGHGHAADGVRSLRRRDSNVRNLDGPCDPLSLVDELSGASWATAVQSRSLESSSLEDELQDSIDFPTTLPRLQHPRQISGLPFSRRRTSGHPGSPLCVSQSALSSSPDPLSIPPPDINEFDRLGVLGQMERLGIGNSRSASPAFSPYNSALTVPPHPFSGVRRAVSFTPALPSAPPSLSSSSSPYAFPLHSNQLDRSLTPPPLPHSPNYTVYNDRLPASSQPQTPAGLSTNGVPRNGLPSIYRGAFTAPVEVTRNARQQQSRNPYHFESPTRRGRMMRLEDQENERHDIERERRWRRQASMAAVGLATESDDSDEFLTS